MRAKVAKEVRSHNRKGGAGGILKRYTADSEWVILQVRCGRLFHAGARRKVASSEYTKGKYGRAYHPSLSFGLDSCAGSGVPKQKSILCKHNLGGHTENLIKTASNFEVQ